MYRSETLNKMKTRLRNSANNLGSQTLRSTTLMQPESTQNVNRIQTSKGPLQLSVTRRAG